MFTTRIDTNEEGKLFVKIFVNTTFYLVCVELPFTCIVETVVRLYSVSCLYSIVNQRRFGTF